MGISIMNINCFYFVKLPVLSGIVCIFSILLLAACGSSRQTPVYKSAAYYIEMQKVKSAKQAKTVWQVPQPQSAKSVYVQGACARMTMVVTQESSPCEIVWGLTGKIGKECTHYTPPEPDTNCTDPEVTRGEEMEHSITITINFDFDSSNLDADSKKSLARVAEIVNYNELKDKKFLIEGHTDAKGSDEYNLRLSISRAKAVQDYLVSTHGIQAYRLLYQGKGKQQLLNRSNPYDMVNRRVEFVDYKH